MERKLLDMMNQLFISEYNPRMVYCDKFKFEKLRNRKIEEKRKAQFLVAYRELCFSVNKYF